MSALRLEPQSLVVVCPDCGQRYDPAKAAKVARIRTRDGRTIKPGRVEAQDVREPGHRSGRHHRAHVDVTRQAIEGWALVSMSVAAAAHSHGVECVSIIVDGPTVLRFLQVEELASVMIELKSDDARADCERIVRAARAVRVDHPWWRAYLHEVGASAEEIARGLTVGTNNRADVLFQQRVQTATTPAEASLLGLT